MMLVLVMGIGGGSCGCGEKRSTEGLQAEPSSEEREDHSGHDSVAIESTPSGPVRDVVDLLDKYSLEHRNLESQMLRSAAEALPPGVLVDGARTWIESLRASAICDQHAGLRLERVVRVVRIVDSVLPAALLPQLRSCLSDDCLSVRVAAAGALLHLDTQFSAFTVSPIGVELKGLRPASWSVIEMGLRSDPNDVGHLAFSAIEMVGLPVPDGVLRELLRLIRDGGSTLDPEWLASAAAAAVPQSGVVWPELRARIGDVRFLARFLNRLAARSVSSLPSEWWRFFLELSYRPERELQEQLLLLAATCERTDEIRVVLEVLATSGHEFVSLKAKQVLEDGNLPGSGPRRPPK